MTVHYTMNIACTKYCTILCVFTRFKMFLKIIECQKGKKEKKTTVSICTPIANTMLCKKALDKCLVMTITNRSMRR